MSYEFVGESCNLQMNPVVTYARVMILLEVLTNRTDAFSDSVRRDRQLRQDHIGYWPVLLFKYFKAFQAQITASSTYVK